MEKKEHITTYTSYRKCNNCGTLNKKDATKCDMCNLLFGGEKEWEKDQA